MELLRFATAGSVDDGKSTLIGRLLYDTKSLFDDQIEAVARRQPALCAMRLDLFFAATQLGLRAQILQLLQTRISCISHA